MGNFLTTVKVNEELYLRFKEINVRDKISFQEFVNKCMSIYIENVDFRTEISESIVMGRPMRKNVANILGSKNEDLLDREFTLKKSSSLKESDREF
jgi:hypothetical protein